MTFRLTVGILFFILPAFLFAQKEIRISEMQKPMSTGNNNCYVLLVPQAKVKNATESWKKSIKKDSKARVEENPGEIRIMGAANKNISPAPFDLYAKIMETADGVQVSVWVAEGEVFLSSTSHPDRSVAIQKYLHDFGVLVYSDAVRSELEAEQKKQKDLDRVVENIVKDQKKAETNITEYNKEIEKLQARIKEEQGNIQKAQQNQATARTNVDRQKTTVQTISEKMNKIK